MKTYWNGQEFDTNKKINTNYHIKSEADKGIVEKDKDIAELKAQKAQ